MFPKTAKSWFPFEVQVIKLPLGRRGRSSEKPPEPRATIESFAVCPVWTSPISTSAFINNWRW
jgi:hypothetical protein